LDYIIIFTDVKRVVSEDDNLHHQDYHLEDRLTYLLIIPNQSLS